MVTFQLYGEQTHRSPEPEWKSNFEKKVKRQVLSHSIARLELCFNVGD